MTAGQGLSWPPPPGAGPIGDGLHAIERRRPGSVAELAEAVRELVARGLAIFPQGGATALDHGGTPGRPGAILDLRSLCRVVDYPHADMTITIEAGLTAAALAETLSRNGQRLLLDVPRPAEATVGGAYAVNASGPRRYGFGRPRDQVIGCSFVTSDGKEVKGGGRVVKNVAGYDLPKLLTGSLGTLGIITQLTLKVRPKPESSALLWAPMTGWSELGEVLDRLNTSATRPVAVEALNEPAADRIGGAAGLPAAPAVLVVGLEDNTASVAWQVNRLKDEIRSTGLSVLEGDDTGRLWSPLIEFATGGEGSLGCLVTLRPSAVVPFAAQVDPGRWALQSHAGNGIVWLLSLGEWSFEAATTEVSRLRAIAERGDGGLVVSRCPVAWKPAIGVWGTPRPDWFLAERIKKTLDPHAALNPGRFVGSI